MAADNLILIQGRPFDAVDERAIGHGPLAALEALASEHPDLVHRPSAPCGGGWWIGREVMTAAPLTMPLQVGRLTGDVAAATRPEDEAEADSFCASLPAIIRFHPLLAGFGTYLIRKD